ncbi:DUF2110 family protein [Methanosarcina horonobensis]
MRKVVTLQHIYGKNRERMAELLKSLVENELKDLEVKVEVSITPENWAEFSLKGKMKRCQQTSWYPDTELLQKKPNPEGYI